MTHWNTGFVVNFEYVLVNRIGFQQSILHEITVFTSLIGFMFKVNKPNYCKHFLVKYSTSLFGGM